MIGGRKLKSASVYLYLSLLFIGSLPKFFFEFFLSVSLLLTRYFFVRSLSVAFFDFLQSSFIEELERHPYALSLGME